MWESAESIGLNLYVYGSDDRNNLHIIYRYNIVNKANLMHNLSYYVYFFSLHVSVDYVPTIWRNNSIYATLGTCYSVCMTVWYIGRIPDSHPYRVTNTKCRIDAVISPDDGHSSPKHVEKRNKRTKKNCAPSWLYLQDYTAMHGQQNLKFILILNTCLNMQCIWQL